MGLFSFFLKSPQKTEQKGDASFAAGEFGSAKLAYETVLDLLEKKDPDDSATKERVMEKLRNSKESLAWQHLETGDNLIEVKVFDEAINLFRIALSLTENPQLQAAIEERLNSSAFEISDDEIDEPSEPIAKPEPINTVNENSEHEFEVLCATLPEDMAQAYKSYGETFEEGYLALCKGDFARAVEKLQEAMEDPGANNTFIPVEFATALMHNGENDQAIVVLTFYVQDNPASLHGISFLSDLFCELKQFDKAHDLINQAPEKIREGTGCQIQKAQIYYLEGDYQKAEMIYRKVLALVGWHEDIARALAITLDAVGKKEEAVNLYADILNKCIGCGQRPNPLDKKAFADLLFDMNDFSDKTLKLYLDLANDHSAIRSDCFYKASAIYLSSGNEKEAARFQQLAKAAG